MRSLTAYAVLYLLYALAAWLLSRVLVQHVARTAWWLRALQSW